MWERSERKADDRLADRNRCDRIVRCVNVHVQVHTVGRNCFHVESTWLQCLIGLCREVLCTCFAFAFAPCVTERAVSHRFTNPSDGRKIYMIKTTNNNNKPVLSMGLLTSSEMMTQMGP